jgi:hypothetical protein
MSATAAPVDTSSELSLVERIAKIEESLKDLKRAARQELKARRRRRGARVNANGEKAAKGETPEQLKAWHEEVRKVWDEMRKADSKTPYKRAVAEASARRKGGAAAPVAAAPAPAAAAPAKASKKAAKAETPAAAPAPVADVTVDAPKKRAVKKATA